MGLIARSLCAVVLGATSVLAQSSRRDSLVVSTAWLNDHLGDRNLVVVFLGDDPEYDKAHIPGSYNMQIEDFAVDNMSKGGLMLEVLPTEKLRDHLGSLGITDKSHVVVVAGKGGVPWATRVMLTLDYAGLGARTSLLDGGQPAWVKEGRPVTTKVPAKQTSQLAALRVNPIIVDADFVKSHLGKSGVSIVDGRAAAFYTGASVGGSHDGKQRAGHIAGAKSIPYSDNYTDDEHVRPNAELQAIFAKAGVAPSDTVVGYCHIGQQATAMLFAARLLGHPVRLYDGSFEDWSGRPAAAYPVETTAGRGN